MSYNSEDTILETLDSIKGQTYTNIELIVSDDSSQDNTLEIAKEWLTINKNRFFSATLLESEKNTGISCNCNRAGKLAKGRFIKFIAADDIICSEYIENCISFFLKNPDCNILFTRLTAFLEFDKTSIINLPEDYAFFKLDKIEQFDYIVKHGLPLLPTPACIFTKTILENMDYFDEDLPMWEDGPMYFKLALHNIKFYFLDINGIYYRIRRNSLSNKKPVSHMISVSKFYFKYQMKYELKYSPLKVPYHCIKYFFGKHSDKFLARFLFNITQMHVK